MTIKNNLRALALTLLASSLFSLPASAEPKLIDRVAAVVDSDVIMESELNDRLDTIRRQTPPNQLPQLNLLRKQVMDRLIVDSIQKQRADQIGLRITDEQLNDALARIAAQNQMSLEQFRKAMEAQGVPFSNAREQIRNEMLVSRLQRIRVGERIQITDQDIDLFLASEVGKIASASEYQLGHILVSTPSDATPGDIKEAEAEAKKLVSQLRRGGDFARTAIAHSDGRNALKGGDLGWRKENQLPSIFAKVVPNMSKGEISNPIRSTSGFHIVKILDQRGGSSQLVKQYQVRHILVRPNELRSADQARELITSIYRDLQQTPDKFAELAKEYSDDPGSGSAGGDLGWASPGDMVPEFENTMANADIGQITAPFQTQFGWHILQVQDTRETDVGEQMQKNQVRQLLYNRRFEEELPLWLRKIRAEAYVDIKIDL